MKWRFVQDDDYLWYLIPDELRAEFQAWVDASPYWQDVESEDFEGYQWKGYQGRDFEGYRCASPIDFECENPQGPLSACHLRHIRPVVAV